MPTVLILGAKSDLARALGHCYAARGYDVLLAARNVGDIRADAKDLSVRYGVESHAFLFDAEKFHTHRQFYEKLPVKPNGVILVFGYLGNQLQAQTDFRTCKKIIDINFIGAVSIINIIAEDFAQRKEGFIIGISSVAGDRGRQSNYIYGSAKAGLSAYLSGLRNRHHAYGVRVLSVKPGFLATKMTENMALPSILTTNANTAAQKIFKAQSKGKDVLYIDWKWYFIMLLIKHIPEKIFKRLRL